MTDFEIILLVLIYMFCYGYTIAIFIKEEGNIWLKLLLVIVSFALALYAPVFIGSVVFEKLNNKNK